MGMESTSMSAIVPQDTDEQQRAATAFQQAVTANHLSRWLSHWIDVLSASRLLLGAARRTTAADVVWPVVERAAIEILAMEQGGQDLGVRGSLAVDEQRGRLWSALRKLALECREGGASEASRREVLAAAECFPWRETQDGQLVERVLGLCAKAMRG